MKKKMISTVIAAAALSATLMFGVNSGAGSGWLGETVMAAENDDSVNLRSPLPDVDGISGSPYTSSKLRTDGQPKVGRGLPSIDDNSSGSTTVVDTGRIVDDRNSGSVNNVEQQSELMSADGGNDGVYDFKDNKTTGTVTVTKKME